MDITKFMAPENEKPLDNIVSNGGFTGIFRTVACIGDSLASGEFESLMNGQTGYHDCYDYSWGQFMARDAGLTVYNFSHGGLTAKKFLDEAEELGWYDEEKKARAYIIALGVNDITVSRSGALTLGDASDINLSNSAENKPTFAGYYGKIIQKYKSMVPKAKFFLVTCPRAPVAPEIMAFYDKHAAILRDIAALFDGCYLLDLRRYGPVYDAEFRRRFYLGGHLNAAGYRLTALMMESYIDYIVRHNPDDFKQIGFVGTPFYNESEP